MDSWKAAEFLSGKDDMPKLFGLREPSQAQESGTDYVVSEAQNNYGGWTVVYASGRVVATGSIVSRTASAGVHEDGVLPNIKTFKSDASNARAHVTACNADWESANHYVTGVSLHSNGQPIVHWEASHSAAAHRIAFEYDLW